MATIKQQKVARQIADNLSGKNKMTAHNMLENAGYGGGVAKSPKRVVRSKGVREELKTLGFDEETAKKELSKILATGSNTEKILAAREIFKVFGSYKTDRNNYVPEEIEEYLVYLRQRLPSSSSH